MEKQNIREYELIRQEIVSVKDCMTTYIGWVIGGTGIAVVGLGFPFSKNLHSASGYVTLVLSLIVSLVLAVLFYKFHSHNRYAGYCELLSQERLQKDEEKKHPIFNTPPDALFTWETCLEQLRQIDHSPKRLIEIAKTVNINNAPKTWIETHLKSSTKMAKEENLFLTCGRLIIGFFGFSKSSSWGFPPFVFAIFFIITGGFVTSAFYAFSKLTDNPLFPLSLRSTEGILIAVLLFIEVILWCFFWGKLISLMYGKKSVKGFLWRFLPIRARLLNRYGYVPEYIDLEGV